MDSAPHLVQATGSDLGRQPESGNPPRDTFPGEEEESSTAEFRSRKNAKTQEDI